jgi:hypothetical protein
MAAAKKMDELLVSWLGSDAVYESILDSIETFCSHLPSQKEADTKDDDSSQSSPRGVIPPFYPKLENNSDSNRRRRRTPPRQCESWEPISGADDGVCVRDQVQAIYAAQPYLTSEQFVRVTKEVCRFPSFFNGPLYARILLCTKTSDECITLPMFESYWRQEMEPYDASDRFFRLVKQPAAESIQRDDFLPFLKALLRDHPGLEFLSNHAEFQEKYAATVITRIFYAVNKCASGNLTSRQIRRSDLLDAFLQVDEEEDINKVTRYLSYEHFYVLYCRFWELDHDRDYRISREDLLKYGAFLTCDLYASCPRVWFGCG